MHINPASQQYLTYLDGYRIRLAEGLLLLSGGEDGEDEDADTQDGIGALVTRVNECQAELDKLADEDVSDDGDEGGLENSGQRVKRKIEALIIDIKIHCRSSRRSRCGLGH